GYPVVNPDRGWRPHDFTVAAMPRFAAHLTTGGFGFLAPTRGRGFGRRAGWTAAHASVWSRPHSMQA
ncbi:MAG: hypothetical protein KAQ88_02610, partial [Hyphomicrobiaceae bacterium]|nr:hypothetical protein [Hyphomicrobiaceae bacterium]